ncbi:phage tail protein [Pantanalinema rosaneae CENA516]|uniref:phage tail protein n=1 Tax=Pantanalinema rosaneae TaxID=1620701 RepID=UPI003D6F7037
MANKDPYRGFNFLVEIDGITEAGFRECSGLDATTDPVDYREGNDPMHVRKLTGLNKYSPITLKRGITDSNDLWTWRQKVIDGQTERKDCSIILRDETGAEKHRWNLRRAWPSKWTGPSFNATSNDVAVETLEIVHEEMKKA